MILNSLKTSPVLLFEEVIFHPGLNIIYAHKSGINKEDNSEEDEKSLHALGKSTLLDFIMFALLFDFEKSFPRLLNAYNKDLLKGISVILEFSVDNAKYKLTRSFENPNSNIYFGRYGYSNPPHPVGKLRQQLFKLIFSRDDYPGVINSNWYYKLFSFFIKVKKREELFPDPINFSANLSELEQTPFHLCLLDINNDLPYKHREIYESIHKLETSLKNQEEFVLEENKENDLNMLKHNRDVLKERIVVLQKRLDTYSLTDDYKDYEKEADELTALIKKLWFKNSVDRKKLNELKEYDKTRAAETYDNSKKVSEIYSQVNSLLSGNIKKTLDDAIEFRKSIHSSRKDFVEYEKGQLNNSIFSREQKISKLEEKRKAVLDKLSNTKVIKDLNAAYAKLNEIKNQFSVLDNALIRLDKMEQDVKDKKDDHSALLFTINDYFDSISDEIENFRYLITSIYKKLVTEDYNIKIFDINEVEDKQKVKISVLEGSINDSTGINQIRTLIYDIAVLQNILSKNLKAPHFIVHDGIFENIHQSHFLAFISLIEELSKRRTDFQYILTLNEHDFFHEIEGFEENKIIKNSVIELTPQKTLLGKEF